MFREGEQDVFETVLACRALVSIITNLQVVVVVRKRWIDLLDVADESSSE